MLGEVVVLVDLVGQDIGLSEVTDFNVPVIVDKNV